MTILTHKLADAMQFLHQEASCSLCSLDDTLHHRHTVQMHAERQKKEKKEEPTDFLIFFLYTNTHTQTLTYTHKHTQYPLHV